MPPLTVAQCLVLAAENHRTGRLRDAELLCREILAREPAQPDALDLLACIAHQTGHSAAAIDLARRAIDARPQSPALHNRLGLMLLAAGRFDDAVASFRRAIEPAPRSAETHNNLGAALKRAGRTEEAVAAYRQAVALRENFPEALNNLGVALQERGEVEEAAETFRRALRARPDYPEAMSNLGNALRVLGRPDEAAEVLRRALALRPDAPEIHYNLGVVLHEAARPADAADSYRRALSLRPNYLDALNNLGNALQDLNEWNAAIDAYRRAIAIRADVPETHNNLGKALKEIDELESAVECYKRAIALRPNYADAHSNLGNALRELSRFEPAEAEFRTAVHLEPDNAEARWNLGLSLLLRGDFESGWELYEVRNQVKEWSVDPEFLQSFWKGEPIQGRTILLMTEQGLGDAIQFIRYVPLVMARGARSVVLVCQPRLQRLLTGQLGIERVAVLGEIAPAFDVCCPLMSLPRIFRTRPDSIPAAISYLRAEPAAVEQWRQRLGPPDGRLRVGLVWAGNPAYRNDRTRSVALAALLPLLRVPNVRWFSLQKGDAARQIATIPPPIEIVDRTGELEDLADTAALIDCLDLVISVDTAVAHLAGALGRPVWTLIPSAPDWRWQLDCDDSPWYPTMRLFRQPRLGDWETPIARMTVRLRAESESRQ